MLFPVNPTNQLRNIVSSRERFAVFISLLTIFVRFSGNFETFFDACKNATNIEAFESATRLWVSPSVRERTFPPQSMEVTTCLIMSSPNLSISCPLVYFAKFKPTDGMFWASRASDCFFLGNLKIQRVIVRFARLCIYPINLIHLVFH